MVRRGGLPSSLQQRPFTAAQAVAAGVSPKVLRGPSVRRIFHGAYVSADLEVTLPVKVAAALLVLPPATVVTGVTAIQVLGLDIGSSSPLRFVTAAPHQVRRPGLAVSRVARLPPHCAGSVCAEPAFVDAARGLDLVDLVATGDWLVRRRHTNVRRLKAYALEHGSKLAQRAAGLVRERVDSVQESRLRLLLVLSGLPEPQCNVGLGTEDFFIGHVDLVYQQYHVVLEYEGDQHRVDRRQWGIDIDRYQQLIKEGWTVLRVTAEQMRQPRAVAMRVHEAMQDGGYDGPMPQFDPEWRSQFE